MDTNRMITVRAHGRMRLLNGFEARLRLLFTGEKPLCEPTGRPNCVKAYTALGNNRKRRRIYTHFDAIGFGIIEPYLSYGTYPPIITNLFNSV